jgi:tetratricopeptide (TPR) repeat protein
VTRSWTLVCALCLVVAAPAHAQQSDAATSETDLLKQRAQQLLSEGNALAREGDFATAVVKFRTAYELYPSPKLLLNIGTSLRQLGQYAEALTIYEHYVVDPSADPERISELEGIMRELNGHVGRLIIDLDHRDAKLSIDGQLIREFARGVRLNPGPHVVLVEKATYLPGVERVHIRAGEVTEVSLSLRREGDAEPSNLRAIGTYGAFGLGGAALIVGTVLGVVALETQAEMDDNCAEQGAFAGYCDGAALDLAGEARAQGIASIALIATGVLAVGGGTLLLVGAADDEASIAIRLGPSLRVEARF